MTWLTSAPARLARRCPCSPIRRSTRPGRIVDGDTFGLTNGRNARLFGVDAFEKGQIGYRPGQAPINLGDLSAGALSAYIRPSQPVWSTGKQTYGRPVVTLGSGPTDPALPMLWQGTALAAPEYLKTDPARRALYMEGERLGRLNLQGAHGTEHLSPEADRMFRRGHVKLRPGESIEFTNDLPELRPEFQRLTDAETEDYGRFFAGQAGNPNFSQEDIDTYWRGKGRPAGAMTASPEFIAAIRKGDRYSGNIDYSSWDAATLRDFKMDNGFAGLRPEVRESYGALLNDPKANEETLAQFANTNGLTFDPRDVKEFFAARARGENPNIPIPIINPGDGKGGAFFRGLSDPFGALDEAGGWVDAAAPDWMQGAVGPKNRETIWNSDRDWEDIAENNIRQNRGIIDYDETHHPYVRAGGQLLSGLVIPFGGGVRGAGGFAKVGAAEGAIYGFGSGDGTLSQRLANIPGNAAGGALGGAAVGKGIEVAAPFLKAGWSRLGLGGGRAAPEAGSLASAVVNDAPDLPPGFMLDDPEVAPGTLGGTAANMDAPNALPSLSSPRVPDVIDVNANRTTRLLDGPTEAMMNAASARVQPGDVLPRAANEVASAEEAAAIGKGLYPPVKAPRERDYLETRQFPARNNPDKTVSQRGPLDLISFARAQGALRDEGGELAASGITNTPRQGDDFTGGERFLGRLVDNENGTNLDEFAHRAWREGYFPELDSPPTIQQLVAALDDTYRGVGRRFRPEDEGQIQAFEAARDQRFAVERAKQEGAPLVNDMGQPATLDDMIANTPPATAYDDWNNAVVSKVGNIRVDKLNSPQEIGQALKIADNVAGGFDAAKRGKISFAETQALAQDLGMTADDLLARRKGQAFNAEEAYAARAILAKSTTELVAMAKRIKNLGDDPGSEILAAFQKALVRHTAIQEQISGATAEAGRALSAFRMMADSKDAPGRILESLVNSGGGKGRVMDAADAIIDLERDPANLNQFIEKVSKPGWKDKAVELWYNFLLSGPQTHVVNMLSNTMTSIAQLPEHAVAAGVGAVRKGLRRDAADRVLFSEVGARATGLLQGTKEGVRMFAKALRTGEASDFVTKVENQGQKAISGIKGEVLRLPSRFLTAEDELFKGIARRMELNGLAVRKASKEGLKGQEARDRAAELIANPTDDMMQSALEYGRYVTFQSPLGRFASKVSQATTEMPILKAVLPFVRTPTNLFKFFVERSPAAPLMREFRKDFMAGGAKRDLAVAKVMVGSGIGAVVAELAAKGFITGSPQPDDNKRRLNQADGWQPYSIKIRDQYYSYKRLDPFALTIGAAADLATLSDGMSEKQLDEKAGIIAASIISNLSNKTWLAGISDLLSVMDDPERNAGSFFKRLAGSVSVPTGVAQVARTMDPTARETPDIASAIQARIPGLSDNLLPKRDVWGAPMVNEGGVGPDLISPIWTTKDRKDPITQEVLRVDATISKPQKGTLTPEQYDRLQAVIGPTARKWLGELFASPQYRAMSQEDQAEAVGKVMTAARKAGKANVLTGEATPAALPDGRRRMASQPTGLPPGF